jgi:periplasmic protein CpxP/Spy
MTYLSRAPRLHAAGVALALAGALTTIAWTTPVVAQPMPAHGAMIGPGAMGGGGPMFGGMLPRLLDRVNATPEQRTQITQMLDANATEMRAQHEAGRALRDEALTLFAQPTVDAKALEALRQKQLAMHDKASQRMAAVMLDISRVLTPDQRRQMAESIKQRGEMMQRHFRERRALDAPKS